MARFSINTLLCSLLTLALGTWFFSLNDVELAVKVLDACETPFESFWGFAAGLTDVGV